VRRPRQLFSPSIKGSFLIGRPDGTTFLLSVLFRPNRAGAGDLTRLGRFKVVLEFPV
jgi:hypothetical protein